MCVRGLFVYTFNSLDSAAAAIADPYPGLRQRPGHSVTLIYLLVSCPNGIKSLTYTTFQFVQQIKSISRKKKNGQHFM